MPDPGPSCRSEDASRERRRRSAPDAQVVRGIGIRLDRRQRAPHAAAVGEPVRDDAGISAGRVRAQVFRGQDFAERVQSSPSRKPRTLRSLEARANRRERVEFARLFGGDEVREAVYGDERLVAGRRGVPTGAERVFESACFFGRVRGDDQRPLARAEHGVGDVPGVVQLGCLRTVGFGLAEIILHRIALDEAPGGHDADDRDERPCRDEGHRRLRGEPGERSAVSHLVRVRAIRRRCARCAQVLRR